MKVLSIIVFAILSIVVSQPSSDKVTKLPGYSGDIGIQYSGYINVNETTGQYLHYWFVQSEGNPSTDPVVLWLNGGPGCSSLDGYWYEQGPFHFDDNNNVVPNPWRWNKIANIIFLESPAGVGFSYSNTTSDYTTNDSITGYYNHVFLQKWFELFPQFKQNPFWIAGESYAGIYVPVLAKNIAFAPSNTINLKGIMVGNGVTDEKYDNYLTALIPFLFGHGFISLSMYNNINQYCVNQVDNAKCQQALNVAWGNMNDINIYDVYSDCYSQRPSSSHITDTPPCINANSAHDYLNRADVKSAIHVVPGITWDICSNVVRYTSDVPTVIPIYQNLIKYGYSVLVYSGDTDGAVPYTGTDAWTSSLGLPVKNMWRQWFIPNSIDGTQVAGFVTEYDGLSFATVKGSGHMVPQYRPEAAFYMFQRTLEGKPL